MGKSVKRIRIFRVRVGGMVIVKSFGHVKITLTIHPYFNTMTCLCFFLSHRSVLFLGRRFGNTLRFVRYGRTLVPHKGSEG